MKLPGNFSNELLFVYSDSQARRRRKLVAEMKMEEILRGTDIRDIGLQELVVANLSRLEFGKKKRPKKIETLWDLISRCRQKQIRDNSDLGQNSLDQILTQLKPLGLYLRK